MADTVLVGVVESTRLIQPTERQAGLAIAIEHPPKDASRLYPCEVRVQIRALIKAKDPLLKVGSAVSIVWYLLAPSCATD
jgi:hypothetical protein